VRRQLQHPFGKVLFQPLQEALIAVVIEVAVDAQRPVDIGNQFGGLVNYA
jgi:hypothetical protein